MNIIRKYKIHLLYKNTLIKKELYDLKIIFKYVKYYKGNYKLIDFIYNNFFNLEKVILPQYPNDIFWFKKDILCFNHNLKNNRVSVNYGEITYMIEEYIGYYQYTEVISLIKNIIEKYYNLRKITISNLIDFYTEEIQNIYKLQK